MTIDLHLGPLPKEEDLTDEICAKRQAHWESCRSCRNELDARMENLKKILGGNLINLLKFIALKTVIFVVIVKAVKAVQQ